MSCLSRVEIPGGFIAGDSVHAYLHDHQGNVRRVVNTHTGAVEQETHYYPFGMPFGESTATALRSVNGSALQPRRYGGKESVSLGEFTFLDFPARPYDAATARFLTPDPLQEEYTPFSPYLYSMGNPMNCIDPTGEDVVVLNYGNDIEHQHLAMLIQDENGKWQYYSVNGDNVYVSGKHKGGRQFNDIAVGCWDSPIDFFQSPYNMRTDNSKDDKSKNNFGFSEGYQITTTEQDAIMRESFKKNAKTPYSPLGNNCATIVQSVLFEAGIPIANPKYEKIHVPDNIYTGESGFDIVRPNMNPWPSSAFKSIVKLNPGGKYYHT